MTQSSQIRVVGARRLRSQLKKAGIGLGELKAAHAEAAKIAEETAAALTPVRAGDLLASLRSSGTKTAGIVRAGGARVPYAGPIHWGWKNRNIKAQMFITRGAQASEPQWIQLYEAALATIIDAIEGA